MDLSFFALTKLLIPRTPSVLSNTALHLLQLSDTSQKWDLRTALTVKLIRSLTQPDDPPTVTQAQAQSMIDPGVKGAMWISKTLAQPPPEDDLRQLLFTTIDKLSKNGDKYTKAAYAPVGAEWTGYRAGVKENTPEPSLSEPEKYAKLMEEVKSPVTILYFHGGAMYLMDPATHRGTTSKLAQLSGGRVYSVRYRLSPQGPFPAALLDALVSYLNLLYPAEDSLHSAVPASNIVFGGDSAGGMLCFALLQFILRLHAVKDGSHASTVKWRGKDVEIPIPAGVSGSSPWMDVTRCLPSQQANAKFDYLPPPVTQGKKVRPCALWPVDPPRGEYYCDDLSMSHPLVSPLAATDWSGSPPLYIGCGEELLTDEDKIIAARAAKQGVTVIWEQYEAMPHCFPLVLGTLPQSKLFYENWAKFCCDTVTKPGEVKTKGTWIEAKTLRPSNVDIQSLTKLSDDEVYDLMMKTMKMRAELYKKNIILK